MLTEKLLSAQQRFHKIYQQRIASANGRLEAMKKDLADFDNGIELLLHGKSHRECKKNMPRFATVYGWIIRKSLPASFRTYFWRKKINKRFLSESPHFAYLLGVYQAKIKRIHPATITIRTGDVSLEHEIEKCFRGLHMVPNKKKVAFENSRHSQMLYYGSMSLMSYISEITEGNTRIPRIFFLQNLMVSYLSGFFDARASPSYTKSKSECSSIIRKYPRINITKKGNTQLLSAVDSALNFLGIASKYNPYKNPDDIYINELDSIKKCIDLGFFRSRKKMCVLKELYDYWKETNELDYKGAYQKLKGEILLQRPPENGPREPGDYEKTKHPDDDDELDELEFDESELEEE